jgi:hypothetical protein
MLPHFPGRSFGVCAWGVKVGSGVNPASLGVFQKRLQEFKMMTLKECEVAIAKTREQFLKTVAEMLGSVSASGGSSGVIPSEYVEVWQKLSPKWVKWKTQKGLELDIGVAHGMVKPGLKGYLMAMAGANVATKLTDNDISYFWNIPKPSSPGGFDKGSAKNPLAKLHYLEFGYAKGNVPARPVWYPVLRWFQVRADMQDDLIRQPYEAALNRARAIVYGR